MLDVYALDVEGQFQFTHARVVQHRVVINVEHALHHAVGLLFGHDAHHSGVTTAGHKTARKNRQQRDVHQIRTQPVPHPAFGKDGRARFFFRDFDLESQSACRLARAFN